MVSEISAISVRGSSMMADTNGKGRLSAMSAIGYIVPSDEYCGKVLKMHTIHARGVVGSVQREYVSNLIT